MRLGGAARAHVPRPGFRPQHCSSNAESPSPTGRAWTIKTRRHLFWGGLGLQPSAPPGPQGPPSSRTGGQCGPEPEVEPRDGSYQGPGRPGAPLAPGVLFPAPGSRPSCSGFLQVTSPHDSPGPAAALAPHRRGPALLGLPLLTGTAEGLFFTEIEVEAWHQAPRTLAWWVGR